MDQAGVVRAEQQRGFAAPRSPGHVHLVREDTGLARARSASLSTAAMLSPSRTVTPAA
jgi:hypothetical protein